MKRITFLLVLISWAVSGYAQTGPFGFYEDALLISQSNYSLGSSARMQAIGGAQVSLGGDISSAISNPAGLGFFNKSVFTISPSMNFLTADSEYLVSEDPFGAQGTEESFRNNFNIANIGTVINFNKGRYSTDKFKGGSLAISITRTNNFHANRSYQGENFFNSIIDNYADSFGTEIGELAFEQFLVDEVLEVTPGGDTIAVGFQPYYEGDASRLPVQRESIEERGSEYSTQISWGGNYDDWLYFGAGMGLRFLNYQQQRRYSEFDFIRSDNEQPDNELNSLTQFDRLDLRGNGVNFNAGVILRPVSFVTLGFSYTTPTFYAIDSEALTELTPDWFPGAIVDGVTGEPVDLDPLSTLFIDEYNLRTPARLAAGASLFIGKSGFLSGDVEFVDYSNPTLNSNDLPVTEDNLVIATSYEPVMNIRAGGEYRIQNFMLRAGYALFPSPYRDSNLNEQTNITFGIGYRNADNFLAVTVVNT